MNPNPKLSLWQKLRRLLTSKVPQTIIDPVNTANDASPTSLSHSATSINYSAKEATEISTTQKTLTHKKTDKRNKISLVKTTDLSAVNANATPIVDYLKHYFRERQWHYTHYQPKASDSQRSHHLSLRIKSRKIDFGYLFKVQEANGLLAVYGILPFLIPQTHQNAAMLLMTQINYDMLVGNLEMDVDDGEMRYKNAIDIEVVGMNNEIIEHLLQSVIAMTTVAHEVFNDLLHTQNPATDMPTLLGELRKQADARTFFLPTQKRQ